MKVAQRTVELQFDGLHYPVELEFDGTKRPSVNPV